jgi:hypothetical protein
MGAGLYPSCNFCPTGKSVISVQPPLQKYFAFAVGQISAISSPRPFPAKRGDRVSSRTWGKDAVDAAASARKGRSQGESLVSDQPARRRTMLTRTAKPCGPDTRCWCQAVGGEFDPTGSEVPSSRQRWRQDEFVAGESAA